MSNIQHVIVQLLTNDVFRRKVQIEGEVALQEYHLTTEELAVLTQLDLEQWISSTRRISDANSPSEIGRS